MNQTEGSSNSLFRWVGYGLLALAIFDFIDILIPPQLMNPTWEFQTVGALVERVPIPLLGLALVFYRGTDLRRKAEKPLLRALSWISLLIGVFYLLLIPLTLGNTLRMHNQNNAQAVAQANQQMSQIQRVEGQVSQATASQIEVFLRSQGRSLNGQDPQQLKRQLLSDLDQAKEKVKNQSVVNQANARLALIKNSFKWNLGALVSGVLFINIWRTTRNSVQIRRHSKRLRSPSPT